MYVSENIIDQWPNFEDETIYLAEVKTWSRNRQGVWFYSTIPLLISWNAKAQAFNGRDGLITASQIIDVRDLRMNQKYQFNSKGDPSLKEWPE